MRFEAALASVESARAAPLRGPARTPNVEHPTSNFEGVEDGIRAWLRECAEAKVRGPEPKPETLNV